MPSAHRDYSGTPLWKKLGIREGARVYVAGPPEGFAAALEAVAPLPDGVTFLGRPGKELDVALVFATREADLRRRFPVLVRSIARDGRLWVGWPKKASKVPADLGFPVVQRLGLDAGLVDNKTAALTDVYQGLQFVVRRADR